MKDFFFNPVINIIISQVVVIWSLVLSHYSDKKINKILTILLAIPLTTYSIFIAINEFESSRAYSSSLNTTIENVEKKVEIAESSLFNLNKDIGNVSTSIRGMLEIVNDIEEISSSTSLLKDRLNQASNEISVIGSDIKNLSELQTSLSSNLTKEFNKGISLFSEKTKNSLNEIDTSTKNTIKAMHSLDQKYLNIINSLENQRTEIAANFQKEMAERQQQFLMNYNQQMMQQQQNMLNNMMRFR